MPFLGGNRSWSPSTSRDRPGPGGDRPHGWQCFSSRIRTSYFRERTLLPSLSPSACAFFRPQSGPQAGAWLTASACGSGCRGPGWASGPLNCGWHTQQHLTPPGPRCLRSDASRCGPVLRRHTRVAADTHKSPATLCCCTRWSCLAGRRAPKASRVPGTEQRLPKTRGARE